MEPSVPQGDPLVYSNTELLGFLIGQTLWLCRQGDITKLIEESFGKGVLSRSYSTVSAFSPSHKMRSTQQIEERRI